MNRVFTARNDHVPMVLPDRESTVTCPHVQGEAATIPPRRFHIKRTFPEKYESMSLQDKFKLPVIIFESRNV